MPLGRESIDVTVVMPCAGSGEHLVDQLNALARQCTRMRWELLVVDNGCSRSCLAMLDGALASLPAARIVDGRRLPGQAAARTLGCAEARGELVLFCDGDDVVDAGWVAGMVAALEVADVVGGRLRYGRLNDGEQVAGLHSALQSVELPRLYGDVQYVLTCSLGVRRAVLENVGGFDPDLPAAEDVDLAWRLDDVGARFGFAADAVTDYRLRRGMRARVRQQLWYGRGNALVRWKHRDRVGLPTVGEVVLTLLRLVSAARFVVVGAEARAAWVSRVAYVSADYGTLLRCRIASGRR